MFPSDYAVGIGEGWCQAMDVTANEITCAPPDNPLEHPLDHTTERSTQEDPHDHAAVHFDVIVYVGSNLQYYVGELDYKLSDEESGFPVFEVSTALVVAGGVVVIAAAIGRNTISKIILEIELKF